VAEATIPSPHPGVDNVLSGEEGGPMRHSSLTAPLRVYDTPDERVAVYYLDVFEEQQFVGLWKRAEVGALALRFALSHGFDSLTLQVVQVPADIT
jgi:hypothetical protein